MNISLEIPNGHLIYCFYHPSLVLKLSYTNTAIIIQTCVFLFQKKSPTFFFYAMVVICLFVLVVVVVSCAFCCREEGENKGMLALFCKKYTILVHAKHVKFKNIVLTISILKLYKLKTCLLDVPIFFLGKTQVNVFL